MGLGVHAYQGHQPGRQAGRRARLVCSTVDTAAGAHRRRQRSAGKQKPRALCLEHP